MKAEGKGILHHKEHELILVKRWRENDSYGNIFVLGCLWQIYRNNRTLVFIHANTDRFVLCTLVIPGHKAHSAAGLEEMKISWSSVLLQKARESSNQEEELSWKGFTEASQ